MSRELSKLSRGGKMKTAGSVGDVIWRIQRLTMLVRNATQPLMAQRPAGAPPLSADPEGRETMRKAVAGSTPGTTSENAPEAQEQPARSWWVLAQGRILDPADFAAREAAREDLLYAVLQAGVLVGENVWVWDETGRAQLVLATLPTVERARRLAERLRQKGLAITVRREIL